MKLFQYTLIVLCAIIIISACKEDSTKENLAKLEGSWYVSNITTSGCDSESDDGSSFISCDETSCFRYIFQKDTNVFIYQFIEDGRTYNEEGTYSVSEDKLTLCQEGDDDINIVLECTSYSLKFIGLKAKLTEKNDELGCDAVTTLEPE
jgi:hypothetical protein